MLEMLSHLKIEKTPLPRARMVRLGVLGFVWDISYLVSVPVGAFLFNSGSYICVLGTSVMLYATACALGTWRLWGFKEKILKSSMTLKELISPSHVVGSFEATFKKRPGKKHIYLLCMILVMLIAWLGEMSETYLLPVHVRQEEVPVGDGRLFLLQHCQCK